MHSANPFQAHARRYENWFKRHAAEYRAELAAVRRLLPRIGRGLEVGVGTGRFAAPCGIRFGLDPALNVLRFAAAKGVVCVRGNAERLPFKNGAFDFALMVTTLCFLSRPAEALKETRRVLKKGRPLIISFVDRSSFLGKRYAAGSAKNVFYRNARFYTPSEVAAFLKRAGFKKTVWVQTLARPADLKKGVERPHKGFGAGAFVVVRGT